MADLNTNVRTANDAALNELRHDLNVAISRFANTTGLAISDLSFDMIDVSNIGAAGVKRQWQITNIRLTTQQETW